MLSTVPPSGCFCDLDDYDFWIAIISGAVVFVCFFVSQKKTGRARRRAAQKGKN